jgi:hypothetical protein
MGKRQKPHTQDPHIGPPEDAGLPHKRPTGPPQYGAKPCLRWAGRRYTQCEERQSGVEPPHSKSARFGKRALQVDEQCVSVEGKDESGRLFKRCSLDRGVTSLYRPALYVTQVGKNQPEKISFHLNVGGEKV